MNLFLNWMNNLKEWPLDQEIADQYQVEVTDFLTLEVVCLDQQHLICAHMFDELGEIIERRFNDEEKEDWKSMRKHIDETIIPIIKKDDNGKND